MRKGLSLAIKWVVVSVPPLLKSDINVRFTRYLGKGQGRDLAPFLKD